MREVAAEFAALGENLEAAALSDAGDNAARLQSLFVEIEAFWSVFETQDATDLARSAQEGAGTVIDAADEDDAEAAEAGLDAIQRTCGTCHNAHREAMPDGSFRIKP
jgi:mono/diheme cytochrome c family protein